MGLSYEKGTLWPEFLELFRQEHPELARTEVLPLCQRMRRNGAMVEFLRERQYEFALPNFKLIRSKEDYLKFIQFEAKKIVAELGPRQSSVPINTGTSYTSR